MFWENEDAKRTWDICGMGAQTILLPYIQVIVKSQVKNVSLVMHGIPVFLIDYMYIVTGDIKAHQILLNRVPEQATEDSVRYQIYY